MLEMRALGLHVLHHNPRLMTEASAVSAACAAAPTHMERTKVLALLLFGLLAAIPAAVRACLLLSPHVEVQDLAEEFLGLMRLATLGLWFVLRIYACQACTRCRSQHSCGRARATHFNNSLSSFIGRACHTERTAVCRRFWR